MKTSLMARGCLIATANCYFNACGDSAGNGEPTPPTPPGAATGPAGGTVFGPAGAQVTIPPGALAQSTAIAIEQADAGAPALRDGLTSFGQTFAFTPHGTVFAVPVAITVPFDLTAVPAGVQPTLYKSDTTQSSWIVVPGATVTAATMSGSASETSFFTVASPPPAGVAEDDPGDASLASPAGLKPRVRSPAAGNVAPCVACPPRGR